MRPLKNLAIELLNIPPTSAVQERAFSYAGHATELRKNKTGPALLNQKLFVHLNRKSESENISEKFLQ